jgi:ferredoxin
VVDDITSAETAIHGRIPVIDREACMGSGNCVYWAPDVFQLDEDGIAFVHGDVAGNEEQVALAMKNCPTTAIRLAGA